MPSEYATGADDEYTLWKKYLINKGGSPSFNDPLFVILSKILLITPGPNVPYPNDNEVSILRKICINMGGTPYVNWNEYDYVKCIYLSNGGTPYFNDTIITFLKGITNPLGQ